MTRKKESNEQRSAQSADLCVKIFLMKEFLKKFLKAIRYELVIVIVVVILFVVYTLLGSAGVAFGEGYAPLSDLPGLGGEDSPQSIGEFINIIFRLSIGLGSVLAVLMIVIGGAQYMSTDAFSGKSQGRERITYALMGLGLLLISFLVLRTINPELVDLNVTVQNVHTNERLANLSNFRDWLRENYPDMKEYEENIIATSLPSFEGFRVMDIPNGQNCGDVLGAGWTTTHYEMCRYIGLEGSGHCCGKDKRYRPDPELAISKSGWFYGLAIKYNDKKTYIAEAGWQYSSHGPHRDLSDCEAALQTAMSGYIEKEEIDVVEVDLPCHEKNPQ